MPTRPTPTPPTNDLVLELHDTAAREETDANGNVLTRATARAVLAHQPPDGEHVRSEPFDLTSPIGPIEKDDLDWYLERYANWPTSVFRERARNIEERFPVWGQRIRDALVNDTTWDVFERWQESNGTSDRRFTVLTDDVNGGAAQLLSIPWELLYDGHVLVQRRARREERAGILPISAPVRVLLITARTGKQDVDHRVCARPLFDAFDELGSLAEITSLRPATVSAMRNELQRATAEGRPYHVVHFDGHGRYDKERVTGGLDFEHEETAEKVYKRRFFFQAEKLAEILRRNRVPIVILQACQSATTEADVAASVAGRLNREGVPTVVAMSHSVLVETARRFFTVFYRELVSGVRVGNAMLKAQQKLRSDDFRIHVFKHELRIQDWFVPVLYQNADPVLVETPPPEVLQNTFAEERRLALGDIPESPDHCFVGRSRELLLAERWLELEPYIVLRGEGGEGKTTLAVELVRWLVRIGRYERAAFVSLDHHPDAKAALYELGPQLDSGFVSKAAMDPNNATRLLQDELAGQRTLLVFDNMETVLADEDAKEQVLELANELLKVDGTRIVFTSREHLPAPFDENDVDISRLDRRDAVRIVANVLEQEDCVPYVEDEGESEDEIVQLVDAVQAHARSLVLLAPYVAERGVKATTEDMRGILEEMEARHPGDRERSLLASVELSLRRLPEGMRERIRPLAVFHGGAFVPAVILALSLNTDNREVEHLCREITKTGLGRTLKIENVNRTVQSYLRFDPGLTSALSSELTDEERTNAQIIWSFIMVEILAHIAFQARSAELIDDLLRLDLPNFIAHLDYLEKATPSEPMSQKENVELIAELLRPKLPNWAVHLDRFRKTTPNERALDFAMQLELLLEFRGRPKLLNKIKAMRRRLSGNMQEWNRLNFNNRASEIQSLLSEGRHPEAIKSAQRTLERSLDEGKDAYDGARIDIAVAYRNLGRAQAHAGHAAEAIGNLNRSVAILESVANEADNLVNRTIIACKTELGDCQRKLGKYDAAIDLYSEAIAIANDSKLPHLGSAARTNAGLAMISMQRYDEAIEVLKKSCQERERVGDLHNAAASWGVIANAYALKGEYSMAEEAYQKTIQLKCLCQDRSGEMGALNDFGLLLERTGAIEEATRLFRRALEIAVELGNVQQEGGIRDNLANNLLALGECDDARQEVQQAIACKERFPVVKEIWKAFDTLADIERAVGNRQAESTARRQAVETYLMYRRNGGSAHTGEADLAANVLEAMRKGQHKQALAYVQYIEDNEDIPEISLPFFAALKKIISGSRDPGLATDPAMKYDFSADLILLLESLADDGQ